MSMRWQQVRRSNFHIYQGANLLILFQENTFEPDGAKIQEEIPGSSTHDAFGLTCLLMKSRFRRPPWNGNSTYTAFSPHLSNTTSKRRHVAKELLSQLKKGTEKNDADIIADDFNTSAYCERRMAKVSSTEETWEETLLIPPWAWVPM